jgi:hypothetical protein
MIDLNNKISLSILLLIRLALFFSIGPLSALGGEQVEKMMTEINNNKKEPESEKDQKAVSDAGAEYFFFRIRLGQGGYQDDRSPVGKLGGGQIALDVLPCIIPVAISLTGEYYTNSPEPTHSYEIASLEAINIFYVIPVFGGGNSNIFLGGGIGRLEVPREGQDPDSRERGIVLDLEGGINVRVIWKFGLYGVVKYIYSREIINNSSYIDFNEIAVLLGISLNLGY